MKLNNEQLTKLALHGAAINAILTEALLSSQPCEQPPGGKTNIEIDVFVVDADKRKPEAKGYDPEVLVGDWKGGKRQPDLTIFKASPGYMIALGKKPKKGETGDCYLLHEVGEKLCFNPGFGETFLHYDAEADTITLYPGGEYTRVKTDNR